MQKQFKVEIENMRLVEVKEIPGRIGGHIPIAGGKEYFLLPHHKDHWQPLDGKIVGESSFELKSDKYWTGIVDNGVKEECYEQPYAIPIQPKEQGEEVSQPATPASSDVWEEFKGKFNSWLFENGDDTLDNFFDDLKQNYSLTKK